MTCCCRCSCHEPPEVRFEISGYVGSSEQLAEAIKDALRRRRGRGI